MAKSVKLLMAAAVAVAGYSAASWYVGGRIEAQWREGHAALADYLGMPVEMTEYRRGLYSATAKSQLRLWDGPDAPALTLAHRIEHGPLPGLRRLGLAHAVSEAEVPPAAREALRASIGDAAPASLRTHIGYQGDGRLEWTLLGWRAETPDGSQWRVEPGNGQVDFGPDMQHYAATLDWGGLEWASADGGLLELQAVRGRDQYTLPEGMRYSHVGTSRYSAERVVVANVFVDTVPPEDRHDYRLDVRDLDMALEATARGDMLDAAARFDARQVVVGEGQDFGPAHLAMALRKLHIPTFEQWYPRLDALLDHHDPAQAYAALPITEQQVIRDQAAALLSHGLTLAIDEWSFQWSGGTVRLDASMQAPALTATDLSFLPFSLLPKLHVQAELGLPEAALVQELGADEVAAMKEQGLLQAEDDQLKAVLNYQGGMTTLNGQPFDPAAIDRWLWR